MSTVRKQFAVYRLKKGHEDLEVLRYRSWDFIQRYHIRVSCDYYKQLCVSHFTWNLEPEELRRQLENGLPAAASVETLQVSDVLAITKEGITTAYYVDPEKLVVLTGFFHPQASAAVLTIDTMDYQIEGRSGYWSAADEIWIDGHHFFLMESQKYKGKACYVVLDDQGKEAADETAIGFTDEIIHQIREYIRRQNASEKETVEPSVNTHSEKWQQGNENGDYLRSAEMTEEQNYTMIDGRMNNMQPKMRVRRRRSGKRRNGKLPLKGRESVLKRLKEYQDELG